MKMFLLVLLGMGVVLKGRPKKDEAAPVPVPEELRVVEDADGFTNLRSGPSVESKVLGKVLTGAPIGVDLVSKGKWTRLHHEGFFEKSAYISTSRLRKVDGWRQVRSKLADDEKSATVKSDGVEARVTSSAFVPADHKITRKEGLVMVDGVYPWGAETSVPRHSLKLEVTVNGKALKLPAEASQNLYEPDLESLILLTPKSADKHALVMMENSDGAGAYCVVWGFKDGTYVGRTVIPMD